MKKNTNRTPKLRVTVASNKGERSLTTMSVYDYRTGKDWTPEQVQERNIVRHMDLDDLKENLCWNVNADPDMYKFKWQGIGRNGRSVGAVDLYAYAA